MRERDPQDGILEGAQGGDPVRVEDVTRMRETCTYILDVSGFAFLSLKQDTV